MVHEVKKERKPATSLQNQRNKMELIGPLFLRSGTVSDYPETVGH